MYTASEQMFCHLHRRFRSEWTGEQGVGCPLTFWYLWSFLGWTFPPICRFDAQLEMPVQKVGPVPSSLDVNDREMLADLYPASRSVPARAVSFLTDSEKGFGKADFKMASIACLFAAFDALLEFEK